MSFYSVTPEPYKIHQLQVSDIHKIYVEESGNPNGIPVIFCHGGPGGGTSFYHRYFYDPTQYRIILFDQRGCGKSTPSAEIKENNTNALVEDMERIRNELNIDFWVVAGGSWGSTLALVYAIRFPEKVLGLILRGIFLGRREDYEWLYGAKGGAAQIFPDYYKAFYRLIKDSVDSSSSKLPEIVAYHKLLLSDNKQLREEAAYEWGVWEGRISTLVSNEDVEDYFNDAEQAYSLSLLECNYFMEDCFIPENYILNNIAQIQDIPCHIIHGRYDIVCKPENAQALADRMNNCKLNFIDQAGHSATERGIALQLCKASDDLIPLVQK